MIDVNTETDLRKHFVMAKALHSFVCRVKPVAISFDLFTRIVNAVRRRRGSCLTNHCIYHAYGVRETRTRALGFSAAVDVFTNGFPKSLDVLASAL